MKRKKIIYILGIAVSILIMLYIVTPYLLGSNCEEYDAGSEVIGLPDSCPYDEEGNMGYFFPTYYISDEDEKLAIYLYDENVYLSKDKESDLEQLYITHYVQEEDLSKVYYYTSQYVTISESESDGKPEVKKEWKKGNGFITIDTENETAKIFMINSRYGRLKSVEFKKEIIMMKAG